MNNNCQTTYFNMALRGGLIDKNVKYLVVLNLKRNEEKSGDLGENEKLFKRNCFLPFKMMF